MTLALRFDHGWPDTTGDAAHFSAARLGDRAAFSALVRPLLPQAFALAWRITPNRELAEEAVRAACRSAHQQLDACAGADAFSGWLLRQVAYWARQQRASWPTHAAATPPLQLIPGRPDGAARATRVRDAWAGLPDATRLVVDLFEIDAYPLTDVAAFLGMSLASAEWHARVGGTALRAAARGPAPRSTATPPDAHGRHAIA